MQSNNKRIKMEDGDLRHCDLRYKPKKPGRDFSFIEARYNGKVIDRFTEEGVLGKGNFSIVRLFKSMNFTKLKIAVKQIYYKDNAYAAPKNAEEAGALAASANKELIMAHKAYPEDWPYQAKHIFKDNPEIDYSNRRLFPYYRGKTLGKMILEIHTVDEFIALILAVARELKRVHGNGVIHSDIKDDNILVRKKKDGSFQVRFVDFQSSGTPGDEAKFSHNGLGIEKTKQNIPGHVPLEYCKGVYIQVEPTLDVYSFGYLLWHGMHVFYQHCTQEAAYDLQDNFPLLEEFISEAIYQPHNFRPKLDDFIADLSARYTRWRYGEKVEVPPQRPPFVRNIRYPDVVHEDTEFNNKYYGTPNASKPTKPCGK